MPSTRSIDLEITRAKESRLTTVDFSNLPFGTIFSDHMLVVEYRAGVWGQPAIRPYGPLSLSPSISALHYGLSIFEGLKALRSPTGEVLLFRPWENARRLNRSAARLAMPEVPESLFLDGLRELVSLDRQWVPPAELGSLYLRPCLFSTEQSLRVKPAEHYLFLILTCPVGPYFTAPVDVLVTTRYARAFPGGTGDIKPSGNYAPALLADREANAQGFNTVLWLDARDHRYVEECGVMNVFFVMGDRVVTPDLSGTILPGVTRDSVITTLRDMGIVVEERRIAIDELVDRHRQGDLTECFGTGTAATVSHVRRIRYEEHEIEFPAVEERKVGPAVRTRLLDVMTGRAADAHGWVTPIGRLNQAGALSER